MLIMIMQLSNQNCHYVNIILSNTPWPITAGYSGHYSCPDAAHHQNTVIGRVHCHCADTDSQVDEVQTCLQSSTSSEYQPVHVIPTQLCNGKLNANFGSFIYLARVQFFQFYL